MSVVPPGPHADPVAEPPPLQLTTTEAAAELGVSTATFRRYVHDDLIYPLRRHIGRSKLYLRPDVEALRAALEA